ncbi:MAG: helix-turn-helix domain-containing protein [Gammaproteobacteria bacterium]|nr:helix-turn-helix domain-containing protein [Gammaproteobacteria bacterium]
MSANETRQNLVKISTASHLSGIRVETLRAWDNRGQLQPTQRVGNTRYYTTEQVERMKSLNTLIQSGIGYSIGELCVKSDNELHQLVAQLHASPGLHVTPEPTDNAKVVVAGWRLMDLRDTAIEDELHQTVAPNLYDVEAFLKYLKILDHAGLDVAIIELPSVWNLDFINTLRGQIDELNHPDCHVIAVSFLNNPSSFQQYQKEAKQKGVSLLDGDNLTWEMLLLEIQKVLAIRNQATDVSSSTLLPGELARLARSQHRVAGVAVADLVNLYQHIEDMCGLAQRETSQSLTPNENLAKLLVGQLRSVHSELAECLQLVRESAQNISMDKSLT